MAKQYLLFVLKGIFKQGVTTEDTIQGIVFSLKKIVLQILRIKKNGWKIVHKI